MYTDPDTGSQRPIESPFSSIPKSFWWAIVTIMTVGYGDAVPLTPGGKAITMVAMITGILTLGLPISVLGTNFATAWVETKMKGQGGGGAKVVVAPDVAVMMEQLVTHTANTGACWGCCVWAGM